MNKLTRRFPIVRLLPLIFALDSLGQAQDSDRVAAPSAPYVPVLTGDFTLVKTFTYLPSETPLTPVDQATHDLQFPPSSQPKEERAVETGTLRKDTVLFLDGSSRDIWRVQTFRLSVYSAHPNSVIVDIVATGPYNQEAPNQYRDSTDFAELGWIHGSMYQGIQTQQGMRCYSYKSDDLMAWIDATNHRPVYFKSKTMEISYVFSDAPDEPLRLPAGYADKINQFKRALRGQM